MFALVASFAVSSVASPPWEEAFRYEAPLACPSRREALDHLDAFARPDAPTVPGTVRGVEITVRTMASGDGFEANVRIERETGPVEQRLQSTSCETVVRAAALLIAVVDDPVGAFESEGLRVPAEVSTAPTPSTPTVPVQRPDVAASSELDDAAAAAASDGQTAPETSARPSDPTPLEPDPAVPSAQLSRSAAPPGETPARRFRDGLVVIGGGGGLGPMPGGSGSLDGAVAVRFTRARLELGAGHWFSRDFDHADGSGDGAAVSVSYARIAGCWEPHVRPTLSFPLCGGAVAGGAVGRGYGELFAARREVAPWVAGTASAALWWRFVGPLALTVRAEGFAAVTRPVFDIDGKAEPVVEGRAGGFVAFAGLGAHFP